MRKLFFYLPALIFVAMISLMCQKPLLPEPASSKFQNLIPKPPLPPPPPEKTDGVPQLPKLPPPPPPPPPVPSLTGAA